VNLSLDTELFIRTLESKIQTESYFNDPEYIKIEKEKRVKAKLIE